MSKRSIPRTCHQCGSQFLTFPHRDSRFCGHGCYNRWRKDNIRRPCPQCRTLFDVKRKRYCSVKCALAARTTRLTQHCPTCGTEFTVKPNQLLRGNGRFCSRRCGALGKLRKTVEERFWAQVQKSKDGCWLRAGGSVSSGYNVMTGHDGRQTTAPRIAWWIATDESPPSNIDIGHTCDTPACVRNDDVGVYIVAGIAYPRRGHLFKTDRSGNMRDAKAKGRTRGHHSKN